MSPVGRESAILVQTPGIASGLKCAIYMDQVHEEIYLGIPLPSNTDLRSPRALLAAYATLHELNIGSNLPEWGRTQSPFLHLEDF